MRAILETIRDEGNNHQTSTGIYRETDGTYLAMTHTNSVHRKTFRSAEKWLKKQIGAQRFSLLISPSDS